MRNFSAGYIAVFLLFIMAGCFGSAQPSNPSTSPTPSPSPAPSPVPTVNSAGIRLKGYSWPAELMGDFPELTGDILDITTEDNGTSVDYYGMEEQVVKEYIEQLTDIGYDGETTELATGGFMYNGTNKNNDGARVVYTNTKYTVITYNPAP